MTASAPRTTARPQLAVDGAGRLLQLVRSASATTVSELAAAVGASRSTVRQRLDLLVEHGLVVLDGPRSSARGRPAAHASLAPGGAVVLVGQVGLSGSRLAVVDLAGEVLAHALVDGDAADGADAAVADVVAGLEGLLRTLGRGLSEVAGIGLGLPSPVELEDYADAPAGTDLSWGPTHQRLLREHFDAPVHLDRDVNLLALAEERRSWPDAEVLVCVKLGTLVDAAVVVRDVPLRGASGRAGHLGGVRGLAAEAGGAALVRRLAAEGLPVADVADVVDLARRGSGPASRAVRGAGAAVGRALAPSVALLDPQVVVVWGYLAEAEEHLLPGLREGLREALDDARSTDAPGCEVVTARLGALAGVRGAARLVLEHVLAPDVVDRFLVTGSWLAAAPVVAPPGRGEGLEAPARQEDR
ncbi:ROK family transcriptional regulator [Pseudokineococcus basanitobsidens]|uniref:ROK family transcriptional regulator n=1 Tax=Pseudokineococcus basanitobsidens TaxID=1926649 RepID=A0ABU8RFY3_9ACTN